ncbi:MAG: ATP-binding protein [Actinomycetota bacterium]
MIADAHSWLPCSVSSPSRSRAVVAQELSASVPVVPIQTAQLLTSELVTNAIRHAGRPGSLIGLTVDSSNERVRVEVSDEGPGFQGLPVLAAADASTGRGLQLVQDLATRWGILRDPTRVWFELDF